ncbi:hypothetical protein GCM10010347_15540 [Streptomyces cirratus]|uniref:Uncharacterized protein n=1 Tax=Streptomyces cirratus TaxID=68187 RepID=A0ABQ3ERA3_9ACTN|nr:hypothetical protein [Streptomyces cirratus]GHB46776.1 hypothetical protein GCM10010347_15540 [Streptomyces cirratus]
MLRHIGDPPPPPRVPAEPDAPPFLAGLDVLTGVPQWRWERPGTGAAPMDAVLAGDSVVPSRRCRS